MASFVRRSVCERAKTEITAHETRSFGRDTHKCRINVWKREEQKCKVIKMWIDGESMLQTRHRMQLMMRQHQCNAYRRMTFTCSNDIFFRSLFVDCFRRCVDAFGNLFIFRLKLLQFVLYPQHWCLMRRHTVRRSNANRRMKSATMSGRVLSEGAAEGDSSQRMNNTATRETFRCTSRTNNQHKWEIVNSCLRFTFHASRYRHRRSPKIWENILWSWRDTAAEQTELFFADFISWTV